MLGNKRGDEVTQVQIVDPVTKETRTCTTKQEVKPANIGHLPELFIRGDDTPLRQPPRMYEFGYTGDMAAGDAVNAGTYIPPRGTYENTKLFLKSMKRPDRVPESAISDVFSTKDYVRQWKTRRGETSSSRMVDTLATTKYSINSNPNIRICLRSWLIYHTELDTQ